MAQSPKDFLGRGLKFPFQFTRRTGGVFKGTSASQTESERHIEESIQQILGTLVGSRVIRRDFGSQLKGMVFWPNDPQTDLMFEFVIRKGIETWEPRVIVHQIGVDRTLWKEGRVDLNIQLTIIRTNNTRNIVFPYFLTEAQRKGFVTPGAP